MAMIVLLMAILSPLAYAGTYMALADNGGQLEIRDDGRCYSRQYRYGGEYAEWVFWPARFVDVKLRPRYWGKV